jgi:excisionase family DNA binding protein
MAQSSAVPEGLFSMSIADVSRRSGIGRTSLFEAIRLGKLKAVKAGSRTLIRHDDLMAYLDSLPPARADKAA